MTNPRGLVIDPRAKSRYIFWTDWGKWPRIERANLDGQNRTAIVTTKLYWPNGLAIDLIRERLYFADSHLDYIESCDYNGQNRRQIIANDLMIHHPHGLSFFEQHLYMVDRGHRKLIKINTFDSKNRTILADLSTQALSIKVANALLQPVEDNPCFSANCEHLCLPSRSTASGHRCECQIGYVKDAVNDNRCNVDRTEFLIVLNGNMIGGLRISPNDTVQPDEISTSPAVSDTDFSTQSDFPVDEADYTNLARDSGFLWDRIVPVNDIHNGFDFTYDFREQTIYWLEHNQTTASLDIQRVQFDGEQRGTLSSNDIVDYEHFGAVFCLEFDPSSRNLFYSNTYQSQIEVINVDNKHKTLIYSGSQDETGVGRPFMLTVNFIDFEIYWIDYGLEAVPIKIGACKMDGSSARVLVKNDLNTPYSIFFHVNTRRVYWSDVGRKKIESISVVNPTDRTVVVSDAEYPTAIAIWDKTSADGLDTYSILYYSDQVEEVLVAFNLKTSEKRIMETNVPNLRQLKVYQSPRFLTDNNQCLINNGGCHQICLPSMRASTNGHICRCSNGLELQVSDGSCRPYRSFILYATDSNIRALPFVDVNELITGRMDNIEALPILSGSNIRKFDFDYKSRSIVWIESANLVKMLTLNFSWVSNPSDRNARMDFAQTRVLFELDSSTGTLLSLALDWVNNLLYYSYADPPFNYIKVTKFAGVDYHTTIFSSNVDQPSSLAVNPKLRYLYWIDKGQFSKLERAFLNGSNRTVIVRNDLVSPTDLFVDVKTGDLYWSDNSRDRIEKCDWDGRNRVVIKSSGLPNPKSVFFIDNLLYFLDSRLKSIYSINITAANSTNNTLQIKKVRALFF